MRMGRKTAVKLRTLASVSPTLFKTMTYFYSFLEAHLEKGVITDLPKVTMGH